MSGKKIATAYKGKILGYIKKPARKPVYRQTSMEVYLRYHFTTPRKTIRDMQQRLRGFFKVSA